MESPSGHICFADVSGVRIAFGDAGQGGAVLLLHGGLLDRRMWEGQFAHFASSYRVIRYDIIFDRIVVHRKLTLRFTDYSCLVAKDLPIGSHHPDTEDQSSLRHWHQGPTSA